MKSNGLITSHKYVRLLQRKTFYKREIPQGTARIDLVNI